MTKQRLIELWLLIFITAICTVSFKHAANATVTWYGPGFYNSPTSSGEVYDPNKLTAAHPSLPFGSELTVNHGDRQVTVTVNDRCACELDLSEAAADRLGIKEAGAVNASTSVSSGPSAQAGSPKAPEQQPQQPQITELPRTGGPTLMDVAWIVWVVFKAIAIPGSVL